MKALSIQQPWAWAILHAGKDWENRNWGTNYRGPLAIHAGKTVDHDGYDYLARHGFHAPRNLPTGGVMGICDLVDCRRINAPDGLWLFGPWGWELANPKSIPSS